MDCGVYDETCLNWLHYTSTEMMMLLLLTIELALCARVYGDHHCHRTQAIPLVVGETTVHAVRFNHRPCNRSFTYLESHPFCGGSGWGDAEASVVCRSKMSSKYGIGDYLQVVATEIGFTNISCTGHEEGLEDCSITDNLTSEPCSQAGIVYQCLNDSQIVVSRTDEYEPFRHIEVSEHEAAEFCIIVWGPLTEPLQIMVETSDTALAVADHDYHSLNHTINFEPTHEMRSKKCMQIEIVDDTLAESWEKFTVSLSTTSSAVHLTRHTFDVYITDGSCSVGSVTVVSDANNSSRQLVEMCSSEGVWSPVCDYDWTLQDAMAVCRDMGYKEVVHARLERNTSASNCSGLRATSGVSAVASHTQNVCQYVVVYCEEYDNSTTTSGDEDIAESGSSGNSDGISGDGESSTDSDGDSGDSGDSGESSDSGDTSDSGNDDDSVGDTSTSDKRGSDDNNSDDSEEDTEILSDDDRGDKQPTTDTTTPLTPLTNPSSNPSSEHDYVSISIFAGVTMAVLVALVFLALVTLLLVYVKRKMKLVTAVKIEDALESDGSERAMGEKHLDNPTYTANVEFLSCPQAVDDIEHNFENPLYDLKTEAEQKRRDPHTYAVLECPSYAIPGEVHAPTSQTNSESASPDLHDYDYVDTPASGNKII